jgi:hypothetical protein
VTTTTTTNFLGIPVAGDIHRPAGRVEQRPIEELQPLIRAVLDDPEIAAFGWHQYTPYFNDGDTCTFNTYEPWFRFTDDPDPDADDDVEFDSYEHTIDSHPRLRAREWNGGKYIDLELSAEQRARYDRCRALSSAIDGGAFDDVLLDAFGDHAEITVRRDGIRVDFYSHD